MDCMESFVISTGHHPHGGTADYDDVKVRANDGRVSRPTLDSFHSSHFHFLIRISVKYVVAIAPQTTYRFDDILIAGLWNSIIR